MLGTGRDLFWFAGGFHVCLGCAVQFLRATTTVVVSQQYVLSVCVFLVRRRIVWISVRIWCRRPQPKWGSLCLFCVTTEIVSLSFRSGTAVWDVLRTGQNAGIKVKTTTKNKGRCDQT